MSVIVVLTFGYSLTFTSKMTEFLTFSTLIRRFVRVVGRHFAFIPGNNQATLDCNFCIICTFHY